MLKTEKFNREEERWQAIATNNAAADGAFLYAVKSTGIYCRPSCGAKLPKRENVVFYGLKEEAINAGFRPCKRCKPNELALADQQTALITELCQFIEQCIDAVERAPSLDELAVRANLSPSHLHRLFKAITGVTPKAYATAHRGQSLRTKLTESNSVTEAIYDAGYNASSPFYAKSNQILGMQPKSYRAGGKSETIYFAIAESSLGSILVAATNKGICAISISDDPQALVEDLQNRFPKAELVGADEDFETIIAQVIGFVEAPQKGLNLPLDIRGTAFQQRVWQALQNIPLGETSTYAEIAKQLGNPKAFRAVAGACARNAIAVAIPCHRVVRSDGNLSGYRWGVDRKRELLRREQR